MIWKSHTNEMECEVSLLIPISIFEVLLFLLMMWRLLHQISWSSHPRRIAFHIIILISGLLRMLFWVGTCQFKFLLLGLISFTFSNSLLLLCTANIIFQWVSTANVGQVSTWESHQSKRFHLHHPLVLLHTIHLICTLSGGVYLLSTTSEDLLSTPLQDLHSSTLKTYLQLYMMLHLFTLAIDVFMILIASYQLGKRLIMEGMSIGMKLFSVGQMIILLFMILSGLCLEIIMIAPLAFVQSGDERRSISWTWFYIFAFYIPEILLSLAFLYIMRRVEQRDPLRSTQPPSPSLVEFQECTQPCVWCTHHRQYHPTGQSLHSIQCVSPRDTCNSSVPSNHSITYTNTNLNLDHMSPPRYYRYT